MREILLETLWPNIMSIESEYSDDPYINYDQKMIICESDIDQISNELLFKKKVFNISF